MTATIRRTDDGVTVTCIDGPNTTEVVYTVADLERIIANLRPTDYITDTYYQADHARWTRALALAKQGESDGH